ncbi:MAG: hypothetical protein ACQCXQ_08580 [Verrucomicrobiales bacterium]|nr:hypothetical protein [Verrucomicrobiota bacterium JB025]
MTAKNSLSVFHQWLLSDPDRKGSAFAIVLHQDIPASSESLIREITSHLNEYDDQSDGNWLAATPELVDEIAQDPSHRRMLGLEEHQNPPSSGHPRTLAALGQRGHVVLRSPANGNINLANTFHVGLGNPHLLPEYCHVTLNAKLMDQKCVAHLIGDVFLEWLHSELRKCAVSDVR